MTELGLIDWRLVGSSALWITGLAVILAAFSFADYAASQQRRRTRDVLRSGGYPAAITGGLALFCLGLFGSAHTWWQQLLWAALAATFGYQAWAAWRKERPGP